MRERDRDRGGREIHGGIEKDKTRDRGGTERERERWGLERERKKR